MKLFLAFYHEASFRLLMASAMILSGLMALVSPRLVARILSDALADVLEGRTLR